MRVRFGAILCLILGAVLIQSGLSSGDSSTVGLANPCMVTTTIGLPNGSCPVGTLTLTEVTDANGNTSAAPPDAWTLRLTVVNCAPPANPDQTVTNNGTVSYTGLYVFNLSETEQCEYTITEDQVAPYTATFNPPPPYTFLDGVTLPQPGFKANSTTTSVQTVTLTNRAKAPAASSTPATPTPTVTTTATPTTTKTTAPSNTASATLASEPPVTPSSPVASASAAPVLATTGPHHQVRGSLIAGIALVLLGGVLLIAGRRPRRAQRA
jgi:hypothetical protein